MYAGLGALFFFLVIFLQQVAGYSALQAGVATLPTTPIMFSASRRLRRAGRPSRPALVHGLRPARRRVRAPAAPLRVDATFSYATDLPPGLVLFSVGLSMTVAPLTAAVLADADESNAGIASAVNNAIARVAGLLATAAVEPSSPRSSRRTSTRRLAGVPLDARARARPLTAAKTRPLGRVDAPGVPPAQRARLRDAGAASSTHAFHVGIGISAALVALGGVLGLAGIRDAAVRTASRAATCAPRTVPAGSWRASGPTRRGRAACRRSSSRPARRASGTGAPFPCMPGERCTRAVTEEGEGLTPRLRDPPPALTSPFLTRSRKRGAPRRALKDPQTPYAASAMRVRRRPAVRSRRTAGRC